jgi:hypothetical protein
MFPVQFFLFFFSQREKIRVIREKGDRVNENRNEGITEMSLNNNRSDFPFFVYLIQLQWISPPPSPVSSSLSGTALGQ